MKFEKDFAIAFAQKRSNLWKSVETVLITLFLIAILQVISPHDPFNLSGPIPWMVFAPLFCSLFYGTIFGILSLAIILLFMMLQLPESILYSVKVREYIVGAAGFTLLTSLFGSFWLSRIKQIEHLNNYVREHLEDLSRAYYLLRVSHERIEESYMVKPLSFREAFEQIKQQMIKNGCEINKESAEFLLGIFSQYCSINSAAFCIFEENNEIIPIGFLGKEFLINPEDPLVKTVFNRKLTTYISISNLKNIDEIGYLAIIPFFNLERKIIGFIIIKDMPFWTLTYNNLEVLSVFAAYFSLQWYTLKKVEPLLKEFPDFPSEFLHELQNVIYLKKVNHIDSSFSYIIIPPIAEQKNIIYMVERQKRSLDCAYVLSIKGFKIIITLMPLTNVEGAFSYRKRMASMFKNEFNLELNQSDLRFHSLQIYQSNAQEQLHTLIKQVTDDIKYLSTIAS